MTESSPSSPQRRPLSTIRARLVALALVSLLPIAATLLYSVIETRRMAMERAEDQLATLVRFIGMELAQTSAAAQQLVLALSQNPAQLVRPEPRCSQRLAGIASQYPIYASLFSTDAGGTLACSAHAVPASVNLADRPYFGRALTNHEPIMGDVVIGRISGRRAQTYAMAMRDDKGDLLGVVGASVDLLLFLEQSDHAHGETLPGTVLTIWDKQGQVVARLPDPGNITGTQAAESPLFRTMSGHGLRPGKARVQGLDGVERQYAFVGYGPPESRLWVSAGIPVDAMLAGIDRVFRNSLVAVSLIGMASLLVAWLLGEHSVSRPVKRLTTVAKALSEGRRDLRVGHIGGAREIVGLADGFDRMIEALDRQEADRSQVQQELEMARDALEGTVAARTLELTQATREAQAKAASLEARQREDDLLNEMSDLLQSCHTLDEAFPVVGRGLGALLEGFPGDLFIMRESGNALVPATRWGESSGEAPVFAPEDCWSLRLGHVYDYSGGGRRPPCAHVHDPQHDYVCIPMLAQGKTLGLLHVRGDGGALERLSLQMVADRIALALANIKLRETLRNLSIRDPLTGLYNRRFVEETFEREAQRCVRAGKSLSVLMVDIDHFKRFNDTYGHDAGDTVLRSVGALLARSFRGTDIVCRLGGEEFLVIMPESGPDDAMTNAEELRRNVGALELLHDGKPLGTVTASIGVATFPQPIARHETLIEAADTALYRAKSEGRNRVCVANA